MKLIIFPDDVLFFRDGRPFDAGGDFISGLSFPPNTSTFYGALRTLILSNYENDFSKLDSTSKEWKTEIGEIESSDINKSFGTFAINDFGLIENYLGIYNRYFPVPADILKVKDEDKCIVVEPEFKKSNKFQINNTIDNFELITFKDKSNNLEPLNKYLISGDALKSYLHKNDLKFDEYNFINFGKIFESENRTGIKINKKTGTADEGFIYSSEFARMNDNFGFYLEVESELLKSAKVKTIKLGGESKTANLEIIDKELYKPVSNSSGDNKYFKMILLTPAIFDSGWIPDFLNGEQKFKNGTFEIKLESGILNRYIGIGGWDLYHKTSKPLRRAVPAGSVYYFHIEDGNLKDVYNYFNYKSVHLLTPIKQYLAKQGFGITYIGEC